MSIAVSLPEKRPISGYDDEQKPEKRSKIGDLPTAIKPETCPVDKEADQYCMICKRNTDHDQLDCPDRSKGMGMCCVICWSPCEIPGHELVNLYKICICCEVNGEHWSNECPAPIYDDQDMFY